MIVLLRQILIITLKAQRSNLLRIIDLNPGLSDYKALYNNASQMARLQMGRFFCMICLDYIPTYPEYLDN